MRNAAHGKIINVSRLKNFPVSFFAILLGMIGFSLAYLKAERILNLPFKISNYILYFTIFLITLILGTYLLKFIKYPKEIIKEWNHPIKLNFYPILAKLFLISSIIYLTLKNTVLSRYLWWGGVILQFGFTLYIMSMWIKHSKFNINHINPSWFIPIVGSIIVPIAGVKHFSPELSWFFFSIGLIWWLALFIIVMNRIIFHSPIADKFIPTFFIMFAPPAIGFISIVKLVGEVDIFAKILYYFALFMFILIMCQINLFKKIQFYVSWWAYSFPMVALTLATLLMYDETGLFFFKMLSWGMFVFLNLIMVLLFVKTIKAITKKQLCIEEED